MRDKLLNTFWLVPLIPLVLFTLAMSLAFGRVFPEAYYALQAWGIGVLLQFVVLLYQLLSKQFVTALGSVFMLLIPAICYWYLSLQ
ncbi:MAG: hypothetical protein R3332_10445 [Pseudohongiellaceae bacterium]|nr:hypothetical protein [Pseudohongiellaceae bacterium]